jgi:hypothetical protein
LAVLAWRYDLRIAEKRLRNKLRKLIARRLKEIDNALAELRPARKAAAAQALNIAGSLRLPQFGEK